MTSTSQLFWFGASYVIEEKVFSNEGYCKVCWEESEALDCPKIGGVALQSSGSQEALLKLPTSGKFALT